MKVKILHTADLHLGRMNFNIRERILDFSLALMNVCDIAVHHQVDLVIVSGDIFDSPDPDPFSAWSFQKFCMDLHRNGIQVVAIVGNHDAHKLSDISGSNCTWAQSLFPYVITELPSNGITCGISRITFPGRDPTLALRLVAFNWMPSQRCQAALDSVPSDVDILVMHQSCSGFMPNIAVTELQIEQLDGKAKYVAMGDLHINHSINVSDNTIVAYPGSIEMCKTDEDQVKYVNIVEYDILKREVVSLNKERVNSRGITTMTVRTPEDLAGVRNQISEINAGDLGLVVFKHEPEMSAAVEALSQAMLVEGRASSVHTQSLPKVISTETFSSSKESADLEMSDILAERIESDTPELMAAVSLWNNPDNSDEILTELEKAVSNIQN